MKNNITQKNTNMDLVIKVKKLLIVVKIKYKIIWMMVCGLTSSFSQ